MNRRGKRLALAVAATGLGVLLVLVVYHWGPVRDHVEAWRFQSTRETLRIEPNPIFKGRPVDLGAEIRHSFEIEPVGILKLLANHSGSQVIYSRKRSEPGLVAPRDGDIGMATSDLATRILQANGWRVLEQFFPRRAYVVIGGEP